MLIKKNYRLHQVRLMLLALLWTSVAGAAFQQAPVLQAAEVIRYVAPNARGTASGLSAQNAANFRTASFWTGINTLLASSPVKVIFLEGQYVISSDPSKGLPTFQLNDMGHAVNRLTLEGQSREGVIFTRHQDDPNYSSTNTKGAALFLLYTSRNTTVRNFTFTAPHKAIGYATNFRGEDYLIENCHFHDLQGVYYGASGTANAPTRDITFKDCRFERVGSGSHAHMIYNAYDVKYINVINCYFEDCAGDYVRFRDDTDFCVVTGCIFRSTGTYLNTHQAFISVPLFNDDDPANPPANPNYEYFGTHMLFYNNNFWYADTTAGSNFNLAIMFHHSGYDPPGRRHLLTTNEGQILHYGTLDEKKALMLENLGLMAHRIHVYDNTYTNTIFKATYRSYPAYGAVSRGGDGYYDIIDTFNDLPVVSSPEQAILFFKRITAAPDWMLMQ